MREGTQECLDGLGTSIEYQTERVICEQLGGIHPIARRLHVADRFSWLAVARQPMCCHSM
jgi:hypothetical protein